VGGKTYLKNISSLLKLVGRTYSKRKIKNRCISVFTKLNGFFLPENAHFYVNSSASQLPLC
jgi:hypothetical protein